LTSNVFIDHPSPDLANLLLLGALSVAAVLAEAGQRELDRRGVAFYQGLHKAFLDHVDKISLGKITAHIYAHAPWLACGYSIEAPGRDPG